MVATEFAETMKLLHRKPINDATVKAVCKDWSSLYPQEQVPPPTAAELRAQLYRQWFIRFCFFCDRHWDAIYKWVPKKYLTFRVWGRMMLVIQKGVEYE